MNRFRLEGRLGNGSYSDVFRAQNLESGEEVALKIMKQSYERGKQAQDMELFTLRKFGYVPTVVPLLESFMHDGHLHLVFELLETNLIDYYKDLRAREGRDLSTNEIKSVLYQICLALDAMHREGYAHRDIKPQNILIRPAGRCLQAKLTDFGLTKKLDRLRNTNYVATRWYRSPELLLNMRYDLSVDVFALGCLMVELYLGFQPFPGNDTIDQLNKIFSILGTPTLESWPEGHHFIQEKGIFFHSYERIDFENNLPGICPQGLDLVQRILVNNPKERLTTSEILAHPYFYGVSSLLPSTVQEYARRQQDVDNFRPISSHSAQLAKSEVYPAVPRLRGNCFDSAVSPSHINDIRSEVKSSEKSTDSTYLRINNTARDRPNAPLTDRGHVGSPYQVRAESKDSQMQAVNSQAAPHLSNSLNNVRVSFEMESVSFQNDRFNPKAAAPTERPHQVAAPIDPSHNTSWETFTRQSPSIVINYSTRQPKVSQPVVDYSTIRNNSPSMGYVSADPSQGRPNVDLYQRQIFREASSKIQEKQVRPQQPPGYTPQYQQPQQQKAIVTNQRQVIPAHRHHESKLQYTMQHLDLNVNQGRSPARSPSSYSPQPHYTQPHRQSLRPTPYQPAAKQQPRHFVGHSPSARQKTVTFQLRNQPVKRVPEQHLEQGRVGMNTPKTSNSMSSVVYYNRPTSNSVVGVHPGAATYVDSNGSVTAPGYIHQQSRTATLPHYSQYEPTMCDAICDYFYVDDQELTYTIGQESGYRQDTTSDNRCCKGCCLPE